METGRRVAHALEKVRESLSRLSINEFKLATNNMLGYDMRRTVKTDERKEKSRENFKSLPKSHDHSIF